MRKIKFRAWDTEKKSMRMVEELSFEKDGSMHGLLSEGKKENIGRVYLGEPTRVDVGNINHPEGWLDDYPLMQYTGLKDKNGKEIYEGDIVKTSKYFETRIEQVSIEVWERYGYVDTRPFGTCSQREEGWGSPQNSEVIGNIYENPELLTEGGKDGKQARDFS